MMKTLRPYLLLLMVFASLNAFSQKAYETVVYSGKVNNMAVKFLFADGYAAASKLTVSSLGTRPARTYLPKEYEPDSGRFVMKRLPAAGKTFSDYFVIDFDANITAAPPNLTGRYIVKSKSYRFVLRRQQQ